MLTLHCICGGDIYYLSNTKDSFMLNFHLQLAHVHPLSSCFFFECFCVALNTSSRIFYFSVFSYRLCSFILSSSLASKDNLFSVLLFPRHIYCIMTERSLTACYNLNNKSFHAFSVKQKNLHACKLFKEVY